MENLIVTETLHLDRKSLQLLDAVFPKEELVSREAKRLYMFEATKAVEDLSNINSEFLSELFSEEGFLDYQRTYAIHLSWWTNVCEWYRIYGKLRYAKINPDWFVQNYRPLENAIEWDY